MEQIMSLIVMYVQKFFEAKSCEAQYEYSRGNTHEDNMMREIKCSYCKHNLAYVSKIQTIHHFEHDVSLCLLRSKL